MKTLTVTLIFLLIHTIPVCADTPVSSKNITRKLASALSVDGEYEQSAVEFRVLGLRKDRPEKAARS